ncbi:protein SPIRAL1-like 1 [Primulina huaijiensis]|uniref:protein SPIRAL1-like 1 n=1 Tax=Primulina huaijiensis TaxID=1492673 RepID=UPI003CC6F341
MGRGVSSGGGQSSLGYLFGGGEAPKPTKENAPTAPSESNVASKESTPKLNAPPQLVEINKQIPAGIHSSTTNNYLRGDGKNTCNFITDRPSTKVHATPGGDSSLGYLFGSGKN